MKKWFQFVSSSILVLFLLTPHLFAQEDEPASPPEPVSDESTSIEADSPAGQEVEINEDNYRQFMELKDAMRQRDIIPENIFKPGSGLQKLDKLPEESQKHLRNQLREIIVQGDPWQPGNEETEYPYTPSVAASTDPALEKQELEAWGELVDSYHDRESQIYENSSGSQAARGSEQGSSGNSQNGTGQPGSNSQNGEGGQGQQTGQEANPDQSANEGTTRSMVRMIRTLKIRQVFPKMPWSFFKVLVKEILQRHPMHNHRHKVTNKMALNKTLLPITAHQILPGIQMLKVPQAHLKMPWSF